MRHLHDVILEKSMNYNKQIITIIFLVSILVILITITRDHKGIPIMYFYILVTWLAIFYKNKSEPSKPEKWVEPYSMPLIVRWGKPYLYIWAKWGFGFDYLMLPQNMGLMNRIDQIILWTENSSEIRTILWKEKIESFEDFEKVLWFIIAHAIPDKILGDKLRYSMNFGLRKLNIIAQDNWTILTVTF